MKRSRRSFIQKSTAAGAGAFLLPRFSIAQSGNSANSKVNIAMIGAGGFASLAHPEAKAENIVALCDVDARFTEVMLLGLIASRHGGKIEWDAAKMHISNRPELNEYLKEPVRPGWEYGEGLWT